MQLCDRPSELSVPISVENGEQPLKEYIEPGRRAPIFSADAFVQDQQTSRNKAPLVWRMGSKLLQPQAVQAVATASCCNMDRWENSDILCRHLCRGQQTTRRSSQSIDPSIGSMKWRATNIWKQSTWDRRMGSKLLNPYSIRWEKKFQIFSVGIDILGEISNNQQVSDRSHGAGR